MRTIVAMVFLVAMAAHTAAAQDWERHRWRDRDAVQIRIGRNYHLPADQIARQPVVVIGGSATIDGRLEDDILIVGGSVRIGPTAQVRANVVSLGGSVDVADGAEVTGEIRDMRVLWPELRFLLRDWTWRIDRGWWAVFALLATLLRFMLTLLAAGLLTVVAPRWIRRMEGRVADAALASGFTGLAAQVLMVPAFVVLIVTLVVTIVGIPLLLLVPFAGLALLVAWVGGFASVAARLGATLRGRARVASPGTSMIDVAAGVMLLFVLTFIGNVLALAPGFLPLAVSFSVAGFVVEYLAWTVGLGAALLAPLHRHWQPGPPPVPSVAAPATPPHFGASNA